MLHRRAALVFLGLFAIGTLTVAAVGDAGPPAPRVPSPERSGSGPRGPSGWHLAWSDEFNGTTIDRSKWNIRQEGRAIDLGCNSTSPRNAFVGGGHLTIRAIREPAYCGSQTRAFSEAYLDTIGKASFTFGRFEIRARSPNVPRVSRGLWPAFWLRPEDGGLGEIDVVELPGGDDYLSAATQAIFYDYTPVKQDNRYAFGAGYPGDGFHTYTTEWEPGSLRWLIDGRLVWQRNASTTPWFHAVFDKPYNLRLNLQVGGWLGDPDTRTRFPADFVVDYVRISRR